MYIGQHHPYTLQEDIDDVGMEMDRLPVPSSPSLQGETQVDLKIETCNTVKINQSWIDSVIKLNIDCGKIHLTKSGNMFTCIIIEKQYNCEYINHFHYLFNDYTCTSKYFLYNQPVVNLSIAPNVLYLSLRIKINFTICIPFIQQSLYFIVQHRLSVYDDFDQLNLPL